MHWRHGDYMRYSVSISEEVPSHGGALKEKQTEYYPSHLGRSYPRPLTTSPLRQLAGFKVASSHNLRLIIEFLGAAVPICEWVIGPASWA